MPHFAGELAQPAAKRHLALVAVSYDADYFITSEGFQFRRGLSMHRQAWLDAPDIFVIGYAELNRGGHRWITTARRV